MLSEYYKKTFSYYLSSILLVVSTLLTAFLFLIAIELSNIPTAYAQQTLKEIESLADSPPIQMGTQLPKESFVAIETHRLKNARVLWLNFDLLHELGIRIPEDGMNPQFEKRILDLFAYKIPSYNDLLEVDLTNKKTWYADRYGGDGIGNNGGSGRAANLGLVQVKGIGRTPLVGMETSFDHAHGGASINESIREAIWGEVLNRELPHGSNRIIAIIDSGTYTHWDNNSKEPQALIVRMAPLRPAHFMEATLAKISLTDDRERTRETSSYLTKYFLSLSTTTNANMPSRLYQGVSIYITRLAEQFATATAKQIYHGGLSHSNYDLSGQFLDYGTTTAQKYWHNIQILSHAARYGDEHSTAFKLFVKDLLVEVSSYDSNIDHLLEKNSIEKLADLFKKAYRHQINIEFSRRAGFSEQNIKQQLSSSRSLINLGMVLYQMAFLGAENINVDKNNYIVPMAIDFEGLLIKMAESPKDKQSLLATASLVLGKHYLRDEFVDQYHKYWVSEKELAAKIGIPESDLQKMMLEQTKQLNTPFENLYRANLNLEIQFLMDQYKINNNRTALWDFLNSKIKSTTDKSIVHPIDLKIKKPQAIDNKKTHTSISKNKGELKTTLRNPLVLNCSQAFH